MRDSSCPGDFFLLLLFVCFLLFTLKALSADWDEECSVFPCPMSLCSWEGMFNFSSRQD